MNTFLVPKHDAYPLLHRVLDDEYGQDGVGKGTFWKVLNRLYR